eukprot:jgi/Mesen1/7726/ME000407S06947
MTSWENQESQKRAPHERCSAPLCAPNQRQAAAAAAHAPLPPPPVKQPLVSPPRLTGVDAETSPTLSNGRCAKEAQDKSTPGASQTHLAVAAVAPGPDARRSRDVKRPLLGARLGSPAPAPCSGPGAAFLFQLSCLTDPHYTEQPPASALLGSTSNATPLLCSLCPSGQARQARADVTAAGRKAGSSYTKFPASARTAALLQPPTPEALGASKHDLLLEEASAVSCHAPHTQPCMEPVTGYERRDGWSSTAEMAGVREQRHQGYARKGTQAEIGYASRDDRGTRAETTGGYKNRDGRGTREETTGVREERRQEYASRDVRGTRQETAGVREQRWQGYASSDDRGTREEMAGVHEQRRQGYASRDDRGTRGETSGVREQRRQEYENRDVRDGRGWEGYASGDVRNGTETEAGSKGAGVREQIWQGYEKRDGRATSTGSAQNIRILKLQDASAFCQEGVAWALLSRPEVAEVGLDPGSRKLYPSCILKVAYVC